MTINSSIFKYEAKFVAGADKIERLPKLLLPEVAFVGKSNVGKSSLINSVCRRKKLARTSNSPGRTRQINFFSIADKITLVDLPGYGYAKVPPSFKKGWEKLIMHYLKNSQNLKLVNFLIDARRGFKQDDIDVMELLVQFDVPFQIILTKVDKKGVDKELEQQMRSELESIGIDNCTIITTSSKSGLGIRELQVSIVASLQK